MNSCKRCILTCVASSPFPMRSSSPGSSFLFRFILPFIAVSVLLFIFIGLFTKSPNELSFSSNATQQIFRIEKKEAFPPKLLEIYQRQIEGRKEILKTVAGGYPHFDNLYNVAAPEVFCPGLVRIGALSDGGKWICNPQMIPNPCAIYSLGINNEHSFESEIFELTKCHVHGFDKDKMGQATLDVYKSINATIMPAFLAKETNESIGHYSFSDIVKMHNHSKIDILKIDIEGGEYDVADQIVQVPICQILIELHWESKKMLGVLETFSKGGFYLFSHEINGGTLKASEFSLIHESCLKDYGVEVVLGRYLS
ncbi:hypothetical protein L596_014173 [Steinernema carpocapsae]|uniref:Methyltransferase domain-containing protein n=1 Tax=Steinernema carpocapsae TaxID=34508 RepID=A0A4U5NB99_STECR|nr:hypothetical protein L596_014173 [Steinernema carpocapsae]